METIPHTLKELAQRALDVQNASNLLGVVRSMHLDLCELRKLLDLDSAALHGHVIARLWASKVASLAGLAGTNMLLGDEYHAVYELAENGTTTYTVNYSASGNKA